MSQQGEEKSVMFKDLLFIDENKTAGRLLGNKKKRKLTGLDSNSICDLSSNGYDNGNRIKRSNTSIDSIFRLSPTSRSMQQSSPPRFTAQSPTFDYSQQMSFSPAESCASMSPASFSMPSPPQRILMQHHQQQRVSPSFCLSMSPTRSATSSVCSSPTPYLLNSNEPDMEYMNHVSQSISRDLKAFLSLFPYEKFYIMSNVGHNGYYKMDILIS